MKILALADEECPGLWDHFIRGKLDPYDLIISCGDLKAEYLSFLVTMGKAPLLYVHGNHDEGYDVSPPEGCDCIDDSLVICNGLRILGLGGCRKYRPGEYQFTERAMARRVQKLRLALWRAGGVDLVVTHAPPLGLGDLEDPAHRGFQAFRDLMDRYHPQVLLHGHTHLRYGHGIPRELEYRGTRIINASERVELELEGTGKPEDRKKQLRWITRHRE